MWVSASFERVHALEDLFLAQKIEVGVAAGTRIDDGGKVSGEIVSVPVVHHWKHKGNFQCEASCRNGEFVDPSSFSRWYEANEVLTAGISIKGPAAVIAELLWLRVAHGPFPDFIRRH